MKKNLIVFLGSLIIFISISIGTVAYLDPFFHYHAPHEGFYYQLNNERFQNRGIAKYFNYDSILTGSSQTLGTKASELENYFGGNFAKLPFSGATFYETGEVIRIAYDSGHDLKLVVRSLDVNHIVEDSHAYRIDLGEYPEYLYNDTLVDDYKYVLNLDIIKDYCLPMIKDRILGKKGGHSSFDEYDYVTYIPGNLLTEVSDFKQADMSIPYTSEDEALLLENLNYNVISLAEQHPETTFIYFIPPYSIVWWRDHASEGTLDYTCSAMESAIQKMLECDNIRVFYFVNETATTTDLNNYADSVHYITPISQMIMHKIAIGENELTRDNYKGCLEATRSLYKNYAY